MLVRTNRAAFGWTCFLGTHRMPRSLIGSRSFAVPSLPGSLTRIMGEPRRISTVSKTRTGSVGGSGRGHDLAVPNPSLALQPPFLGNVCSKDQPSSRPEIHYES